ncbi:GNAT family N-acetyltransferase [Corallococcus carmarthensis]|uniref:GNAT family N-acetyltransferase n=1 Tax=Corallococcus carmarthensis TaxID=2316728 RepID=UPI00148E6198|nr:GNAT family N-acetyltransferase [Corallococcus carmarthensis]NOK15641.1 GNAT family N-acetyltransferase [Corallococcus carmarthensis]
MVPNDPLTQIRIASPFDEAAASHLLGLVFPDDPHPYAQNIRESNCLNAVATNNEGRLIGFATLLIDPTTQHGTQEWRKYPLYIGAIATEPIHRRKGVGTDLMEFLAQEARKSAPHYQLMHLHVTQDSPSIHFHENCGFVKISTYKNSWLMRRPV